MSAAVVAHGDRAPVLDPTEHGFDFVALAVERSIIGLLDFTVLAWRDAWIDAFCQPIPSLWPWRAPNHDPACYDHRSAVESIRVHVAPKR